MILIYFDSSRLAPCADSTWVDWHHEEDGFYAPMEVVVDDLEILKVNVVRVDNPELSSSVAPIS